MPGLQTGQLDAQAGVAGGGEALVADQYSNQVDQNRRTADTPRQEAGVSAYRGAGDQGNAALLRPISRIRLEWQTGLRTS